MKYSITTRGLARQIVRWVLLTWLTLARSGAATNYIVSLTNPEQHLVEV